MLGGGNGFEVSFRGHKNVLNLVCGDGCPTLNILQHTELCALRWLVL